MDLEHSYRPTITRTRERCMKKWILGIEKSTANALIMLPHTLHYTLHPTQRAVAILKPNQYQSPHRGQRLGLRSKNQQDSKTNTGLMVWSWTVNLVEGSNYIVMRDKTD